MERTAFPVALSGSDGGCPIVRFRDRRQRRRQHRAASRQCGHRAYRSSGRPAHQRRRRRPDRSFRSDGGNNSDHHDPAIRDTAHAALRPSNSLFQRRPARSATPERGEQRHQPRESCYASYSSFRSLNDLVRLERCDASGGCMNLKQRCVHVAISWPTAAKPNSRPIVQARKLRRNSGCVRLVA